MNSQYSALELARLAGAVIIRSNLERGVRLDGHLLFLGPNASDDEIATIACRKDLAARGISDEELVVRNVEAAGFQYARQLDAAV